MRWQKQGIAAIAHRAIHNHQRRISSDIRRARRAANQTTFGSRGTFRCRCRIHPHDEMGTCHAVAISPLAGMGDRFGRPLGRPLGDHVEPTDPVSFNDYPSATDEVARAASQWISSARRESASKNSGGVSD